jgi:hypothetical protein
VVWEGDGAQSPAPDLIRGDVVDRVPSRGDPETDMPVVTKDALAGKHGEYDLRTNLHFMLKENPLKRSDLDDFLACYNPKNRHERKESERFKSFTYDDLIKRDKVNLDIFWLKLQGADRHLTPALSPVEAERETLFWFNALLIASNGTDKRVGSLTAELGAGLRCASARAPSTSSAKTSRAGCRWILES